MTQELPEGFTLDETPVPSGYDDLPEGFVLDSDPSPAPAPAPIEPAKSEPKLRLPSYNRPVEAVRAALRGGTLGLSDIIGTTAATGAAYARQAITGEGDKTLGELKREIKGDISAQRDVYREDRPWESAGMELAGGIAPALVTGGTAMAVPASTMGKAALGAGLGALQGGIYGATQADVGEELQGAKTGAAIGGVVGGALPVVAGAAGRVISPKASTNPNVKSLLSEGVEPTIGGVLGGRAQVLEDKLTSLPITGDMISVAKNRAVSSVERAAYNRALNEIGENLPKGMSGRDAAKYAARTLKDKYNDVLTKIGAITPDQEFADKTDNLLNLVNSSRMPQEAKDKFLYALDEVRGSIDQNGVMTSEAFKQAESSLSAQGRKLSSSQDVYDDKIYTAVAQLKQELKDMLQRQSGPLADDLAKTNKAWANYKIVQRAGSSLGAEEGKFSVEQLQSAVRAMDKSKDKARYFEGDALMQDLSEPAKTVIGTKTPNSFTADRMMAGLGAIGAGGINPLIPAGLTAGGAMYTRPVQNALVSLVAKRPDIAPEIAQKLGVATNYLIAPSSVGAARLANE